MAGNIGNHHPPQSEIGIDPDGQGIVEAMGLPGQGEAPGPFGAGKFVAIETDMVGKVDISVNVSGGGRTGQAGSIVLGIARALQAKNPANHPILSEGGYLTRDSRMVERKKYGHKKARRSFQFSKR